MFLKNPNQRLAQVNGEDASFHQRALCLCVVVCLWLLLCFQTGDLDGAFQGGLLCSAVGLELPLLGSAYVPIGLLRRVGSR